MMKSLRKNYKTILWVLAVLIIPPFIWWGAGSYADKDKIPAHAGFIGDSKISLREYRTVYEALYRSMKDLFGGIPSEEILEELTWTRLLLLHEAKQRKIRVTDEEVRRHISQIPHFQKDGRFDPASYQRAFGEHARSFEESIRQDFLLQKLQETVTAGIEVSGEELLNEYVMENKKVGFSYVLISKDQTQPSAQERYQELEQKIQSGIAPADAFTQAGLSPVSTELLNENEVIPQLGPQPKLMEAAFKTDAGKLGPLADLQQQGYCLFWVNDKVIPKEEDLRDDDRTVYQEKLLQRKKNNRFYEWLSEIQEKTPIKSALSNLKN